MLIPGQDGRVNDVIVRGTPPDFKQIRALAEAAAKSPAVEEVRRRLRNLNRSPSFKQICARVEEATKSPAVEEVRRRFEGLAPRPRPMRQRRGRPPGRSAERRSDLRLMPVMYELVYGTEKLSVRAAAYRVASMTLGTSLRSTADRLRRLFTRTYGSPYGPD